MQTRRDQVQAHAFVVGRMVSALVRAEPDAPFSPLRRFTVEFRDVGYQLLRHSDRELFDRFLDVVRSWGTDPHENAPDRVQRVREDCRRFAEVLDRALDNVSKRAELKDYPLDEQRIREALARRLSGV